jgi:hypothetical protein
MIVWLPFHNSFQSNVVSPFPISLLIRVANKFGSMSISLQLFVMVKYTHQICAKVFEFDHLNIHLYLLIFFCNYLKYRKYGRKVFLHKNTLLITRAIQCCCCYSSSCLGNFRVRIFNDYTLSIRIPICTKIEILKTLQPV